jgi:hypothetical protein
LSCWWMRSISTLKFRQQLCQHNFIWQGVRVVLATVPFSDRFYYSGSTKTRTCPVLSGIVPNGSLNSVHEYWSDNLVFGTWNMQLQTAHLLVVSDFWYL